MAQRRIEIMQENASGVFEVVAVTPTAAKGTISLNASGVPVVAAAPNHIVDVTAAVQADASDLATAIALVNELKTNYNDLVTKFNSLLVAVETANVVKDS